MRANGRRAAGRRDAQRGAMVANLFTAEDDAVRAEFALERELRNAILDPGTAAASATHDNIEDRAYGDAVSRANGPRRSNDPAWTRFLPRNQRSWHWLRNNSTFFYQADDNIPYYLRIKESNVGVRDGEWAALFPGNRVARRSFRTYELVDVRNNNFDRDNHIADTIYYEVDLDSAAPRGGITIHVDQDVPETDSAQTFKDILTTMILHLIHNNEHRLGAVRIHLSYEVHSKRAGSNDLILKTAAAYLPIVQDQDEMTENAGHAISQLLSDIREWLIRENYYDNNVQAFHPVMVRFLFQDNPQPNGAVYTQMYRDFHMPRGGCMTSTGIPKGLIKVLQGSVASRDIYTHGVFVDNNCGIREAVLAALQIEGLETPGIDISILQRKSGVKEFYHFAAEIRARTPGVPPFIQLTPAQVWKVISTWLLSADPYLLLRMDVAEVPYPGMRDERGALKQHAYRGDIHTFTHPDRANSWYYSRGLATPEYAMIDIALAYGHYYGVLNGERRNVHQITYCPRCMRYVAADDGGRVCHATASPSCIGLPQCSLKKTPAVSEQIRMIEQDVGEIDIQNPTLPVRNLMQVKSVNTFSLIPDHRIGFMDLETWRPRQDGYHEVYAVGWIPEGKQDISVSDVKIYSILVDPSPNACLVLALSALVEHVATKGYTAKQPYFLYLYNGSAFDNLFILHVMSSYLKLHPDKMAHKQNRIMTMTYMEGALVIRDLYLMTMCSLKAACKVYKVDDHLAKGEFDHDAITSLSVIADKWSEISDYLAKDLTALNMVYFSFRETSHSVYGLDITKRVTMPHFAYDFWISTLSYDMRKMVELPKSYNAYEMITRGYYGGRVTPIVRSWKSEDYRLPYHSTEDYFIGLDVVSLYPTAMWYSKAISEKYFPETGRNVPLYFCGESRWFFDRGDYCSDEMIALRCLMMPDEPHPERPHLMPTMEYWRMVDPIIQFPFGLSHRGALVWVDVTCPNDISIALLPHKDDNGNTCWNLAPKVNQCYVLEEILDAICFGYTVTKLHRTIVFYKRADLFAKAMDICITGKKACSRGDPRRDIYKLGANSIYGKHGQKPIHEQTRVVDAREIQDILTSGRVLSIEPICDGDDFEAMREQDLNREMWVGLDGDAPLRTERLIDKIGVTAFVVKEKPEEITLTKPTYLGCQVTAYSRIIMNFFFERFGAIRATTIDKSILYTDTDSGFAHRKCTIGNNDLMGEELGQLDDELSGGKIIAFESLAPKCYAITYRKPDNSLWMKIRIKGFPHSGDALPYKNYEMTHEELSPFLDSEGKLDPTKLKLGEKIYETVDVHGVVIYHKHLTTDIYEAINNGQIVDMTCYFTSMRRRFFGAHGLGNVAGIQHCSMHRTLKGAKWWDGGLHRVSHRQYPFVSFPRHHHLSFDAQDNFGMDVDQE